jgi:protein-tyrosine phosphatase
MKEKWDHVYFGDKGVLFSQLSSVFSDELSVVIKKIRKKYFLLKIGKKSVEGIVGSKKILILCYGNICRSPFAEHFLKNILDDSSYDIKSTGFHKSVGRSSPEYYQCVCDEFGINLEGHKSSLISSDIAGWADVILLMDFYNYELADKFLSPNDLKKCYFLGGFSSDTIEVLDPYGLKKNEIFEIVNHMKKSILAFAKILQGRV